MCRPPTEGRGRRCSALTQCLVSRLSKWISIMRLHDPLSPAYWMATMVNVLPHSTHPHSTHPASQHTPSASQHTPSASQHTPSASQTHTPCLTAHTLYLTAHTLYLTHPLPHSTHPLPHPHHSCLCRHHLCVWTDGDGEDLHNGGREVRPREEGNHTQLIRSHLWPHSKVRGGDTVSLDHSIY